jgi:hypothetical protein
MGLPCLVVVTYQLLDIREHVFYCHGVPKSLVPIQHIQLLKITNKNNKQIFKHTKKQEMNPYNHINNSKNFGTQYIQPLNFILK